MELYPAVRQTVVAGSGALFHCRPTAGIPEPKITWVRTDRRPMPQGVEILNGGVMRSAEGHGVRGIYAEEKLKLSIMDI